MAEYHELLDLVKKEITSPCIHDIVRNTKTNREGQVTGFSVGGQSCSPWLACPKEVWEDPAGYVVVRTEVKGGITLQFWTLKEIERTRVPVENVVDAVIGLLDEANAIDWNSLYIEDDKLCNDQNEHY
jgi:hypothetical protein